MAGHDYNNGSTSTSESGSGPSTPSQSQSRTSTIRSQSQSQGNRAQSSRPQPIQTQSHSRSHRQQDQDQDQDRGQGQGRQDGSMTPTSTRHEDDGRVDEGDERASEAGSQGTTNMRQVPGGGLWLPAVKGTIGGIESPRRHVRSSASISTLNPGTPTTANSQPTLQTRNQPQAQTQAQYEPSSGARAAVFRADPTVKSCLLGLKLDGRDEIARLFGVA
ncbi:hypothetical protein IAU59_003218 [Kwoniella sp. CBS 9459]